MKTVKIFHSPFVVEHSSCSSLTPHKFIWSSVEGEYEVYVDSGIIGNVDNRTRVDKKNRYGWICESREIIPGVYNYIFNNLESIFNNFNKIFTCDKILLDLNKNFVYCPQGSNYPWINKTEWGVPDKSKLCSMFCSPKNQTSGHRYRHHIAKLAIDLGYDVAGGCHSTSQLYTPGDTFTHSKVTHIKPYMFHIVVENSNYDSYWTEKITDCFAVGTIPIYWGTSNIAKYFDPAGILFLNKDNEKDLLSSLSKSLYYERIDAVRNNFNIVTRLRMSDDILFDLIESYSKI